MSQWNKLLISAFIALFVVVLVLLVMILNFDSAECKNTVHQEYLSPNSELKAVVFERNCGDPDLYSTQISIIGSFDSIAQEAGDVLIINGRAMQVAPKLRWSLPNELHIYHKLTGDEYRIEKSWSGKKEVRIKYVVEEGSSI